MSSKRQLKIKQRKTNREGLRKDLKKSNSLVSDSDTFIECKLEVNFEKKSWGEKKMHYFAQTKEKKSVCLSKGGAYAVSVASRDQY